MRFDDRQTTQIFLTRGEGRASNRAKRATGCIQAKD
jgi:hypothetical protein